MCGIVGVVSKAPVNQLIYDGLLLLQHRGQDAAGIVTQHGRQFYIHQTKGLGRDLFPPRTMRALPGTGTDTHAVETAVLRLRTALGDKNIVSTVVKRGYRLPVDEPLAQAL